MQIGIFTRVFPRPTLDETLEAVTGHGIHAVQHSLPSSGQVDIPAAIDPDLVRSTRAAFEHHGVAMAAVSGTFNVIHPDPAFRDEGLLRLRRLAEVAPDLGTSVITLSTGTRNPDSTWRYDPDNATPAAWDDCVASLCRIAEIGEAYQVDLAFETEVSNVVDSAAKARRMLDAVDSPRLKIVMDGANLFHRGELPRMAEILDEAFALLGRDIVLAHAKDLRVDGEAGHEAAGTGFLDYGRYIALLRKSGYTGAVVLHSLTEAQVGASVAFLREKLRANDAE